MHAAARLLDANANRAREALRVLEDAARFAVDDAALCADLKALRHDLQAALAHLPPGWLEANRATGADVGREVTTAGEMQRGGLAEIAIAAGKRLGEALRVMEEVSKLVEPRSSAALKQLRYRGYELEGRLHRRLGSTRARQWSVCVLITEALCRRPWLEVARAAVAGGAGCVQLREKSLAGGELAARTRALREIAAPGGASVIVNDRADVALAAGADGVHLGTDDLDIASVRRIAGRTLLIGASTHDRDEARRAVDAGADYCGVGMIFQSALKPQRRPAGTELLEQFLAAHRRVPHLAIGGIDPGNARSIAAAGGRGIAVSSCVCGADDPEKVVAELVEVMGGA